MEPSKKKKIVAASISIILHLCIIAVLFWVVVSTQAEDLDAAGLPVNEGLIEVASTGLYAVEQQKVKSVQDIVHNAPRSKEVEELLTQDISETAVIAEKKKQPKREQKKLKQKTEERKNLLRDAPKNKPEHSARVNVGEAFRRAGKANSRGTDVDASSGTEGSADGNVSSGGRSKGIGGYGSWELEGRGLVGSALPRPEYSGSTEGRIVVLITVNPDGKVIDTAIGRGTNIDNLQLRKNVIKAAKQARFTKISGIQNQKGSITYIFRLKS